MNTIKLATIVATGVLTVSSFAADGNARVDGMGIAYDAIGIIDDPHGIVNWKDLVQMTGREGKDWNFFATKSLGDNFVLGISSNIHQYGSAKMMPFAVGWKDKYATGDYIAHLDPTGFVPYPALHLGFNAGEKIYMGFKVYASKAKYTFSKEGDTTSAQTYKAGVTDIGGKFGMSIALNYNFSISPTFGMGFPQAKMEYNDSTAADADGSSNSSWKTDGDLFLEAGLGFDIGLPRGLALSVGTGLQYTTSGVKKSLTTSGEWVVEDSWISENLAFSSWIGVSGKLSDGTRWNVEWDPYISIPTYTIDVVDGQDAEGNDIVNAATVNSGRLWENKVGFTVEKTIESEKFLDYLTPRCGFIYKNSFKGSKSDYVYDSESFTVSPGTPGEYSNKYNTNDGFDLKTGIGFTKGRGTLDIATDIASWKNGVITGPSVVSATLTLDIAKKSGGYNGSSRID